MSALPFSPQQGDDPRHTTQPALPEACGELNWMPDDGATHCTLCKAVEFGLLSNRRHHCRKCGMLVCAACSDKTLDLQESITGELHKDRRVCRKCYDDFYALFAASPKDPAPAATGGAATAASAATEAKAEKQ